MGCECGFKDDYEKCQYLLEEYENLLEMEEEIQLSDKKYDKHVQEKENIKGRIRELLESINKDANAINEIDGLQKLNEKYQNLLTEESQIKNND